jgi:NADH dehydrogenase (ubiquinone) Fe-S protein 1
MAKEGWQILRVLSEDLGLDLPYNNQEEIRVRMSELSPSLMKYEYIESYSLFERGLG